MTYAIAVEQGNLTNSENGMAADVRPVLTRANLFDVAYLKPNEESDFNEEEMHEIAMQYMAFRDVYYSHGFAKRIFPEFAEKVDLENTARLTESSITDEDEHNFDILDKHVLDAFLAFKLETEGLITKEASVKLMLKSYRKVGTCANCSQMGNLRCKKCKKTHYCSKECQRAHWSTHKKTCKPCEAS